MRCKHCLTDFHAEAAATPILFANSPIHLHNGNRYATIYGVVTTVCPRCEKAHITLTEEGQARKKELLASFLAAALFRQLRQKYRHQFLPITEKQMQF